MNGVKSIYTRPTVVIGGKLHQGPASCKRHICMIFVVLHDKYQRGEHVVPQACDAVQGNRSNTVQWGIHLPSKNAGHQLQQRTETWAAGRIGRLLRK
jgi:hypothetical protein